MFDTPVALIIFRRAAMTERALRAIARVRPRRLFVIADGPRPNRPDDIAECSAARSMVDAIDWNCEVIKNYAPVNLGCGQRPATGITWLFEQVEHAIILEDDCLPDPSFFHFCAEMLIRYRDDERVMSVGGSNYQNDSLPIEHSYIFSRMPGCVGSWATWRRAWRHFDQRLVQWPLLRSGPLLKAILEHDVIVNQYQKLFDEVCATDGNISYWDHQWSLACWANRGLSIVPRLNLVSNVGWGPGATHCQSKDHPSHDLTAHEMPFPLKHPPMVLDDMLIDKRWLLNDSMLLQDKRMPIHRRMARKLKWCIRELI